MAVTAVDVIGYLGITQNLDNVDDVVLAVNGYIESLPGVRDRYAATYPGIAWGVNPAVWSDQEELAGLMLASRLYRRRNSQNGVESSVGGATVYVSKYDSDIARLLQIDGFEKPSVG